MRGAVVRPREIWALLASREVAAKGQRAWLALAEAVVAAKRRAPRGRGGMVATIEAPRPIAPLSTSTVTSSTPTLHWSLPEGADGAFVEIYKDRQCTTLITSFSAIGASGKPTSALPAGNVFWRLTGTNGGAKGTPNSIVWEFTVGHGSALIDTSFGTRFDIDGDGFSDFVGTFDSKMFFYPGSTSGLRSTPSASLSSLKTGDGFAGSFGNAGDINGDGFSDLVVGAAGGNDPKGEVYVYLGSASGISATAAFTFKGTSTADIFGASVAGAGDINGDGFADIIVGSLGGEGSGAAYVYHGSAAGLVKTLTLTPNTAEKGKDFGISVAGIGDLNEMVSLMSLSSSSWLWCCLCIHGECRRFVDYPAHPPWGK